jgi:hypothetical protein
MLKYFHIYEKKIIVFLHSLENNRFYNYQNHH